MDITKEMTIPKSCSEVIFNAVISVIVIVFSAFAVSNIINGIALIASCLWVAIVIMILWNGKKEDGSLYTFLVYKLGDLVGKHFVAVLQLDSPSRELYFGFRLFGHQFIKKTILVEKIETVEWGTGQATAMAGKDMNDWHVSVWFDHGDPERSETQRKWHPKPDQDIYIVGPSTRRAKTESLGLALISLLHDSGATLIQTDNPTCFVRKMPETIE